MCCCKRSNNFGASLIVLEMKGGRIRPIDVGCTFRWILQQEEMASHQLGYGVSKEAEGVVHAARLYINKQSSPEVGYYQCF